MSIYKKIDGKDVKVADNSVVDHNQLANRDAYGAHPISAIRNLPEKLTGLKNITRLIQENAGRITLVENGDGTLTFTDYNGNQLTVQGGYLPDGETIILEVPEGDTDEKLSAIALKTSDGVITGVEIVDEFTNLKSIVNAKGGYLDSYNFQTADPTQEELTAYAIQDIGDISEPNEIWNGTRVINLYNNETWSWDLHSLTWSNLGRINIISDANNTGLHGLVTGSLEDYMGRITSDGQIAINQLPELADTVSQNTQDIETNAGNITQLNTDLTNEINARTEADGILQNNIDAEALLRSAADSNLQNQLDAKIVDTYNNTSNKGYSTRYLNKNFVPMTFSAKLYFEKENNNNVNLVIDKPALSNNNIIETTTTNTDISWASNSAELLTSRSLGQITDLNASNGYTYYLNFETNRDCTLNFGAKVKYYDTANEQWVYISSNQLFGSIACTANTLTSTSFTVHFDLLSGEKEFAANTEFVIEIYKQQDTSDQLSTTYYCGVEVDNSAIYSYAQFLYNSAVINTESIADGAITYPKLSSDLQSEIDQITVNENNIINLQTDKQDKNLVFTSVVVPVNAWASDDTYDLYKTKATIPLTGVTSAMIPTVVFDYSDSISGKYYNTVETYDGGIYIWSTETTNEQITLPLVIIQKVMA